MKNAQFEASTLFPGGLPTSVAPCSFKLGRTMVTVFGGPYRLRPASTFGVLAAREIAAPADAKVLADDFQTPTHEDMDTAIRALLIPLARGVPVYIGCMGGIGRTGLVIACLLKTAGVKNPVQETRMRFKPHAVETQAQAKFCDEFTPSLKTKAVALVAKALLFL